MTVDKQVPSIPHYRLPSYKVEGSGPLLIYVAGLDGTGQLLFKQIPALSVDYRVVTYRSRDHGSFTYEELAADVAAIIRDLGERRATVLGESFGGTVALWFAILHPDLVERLVIVNSFPRFRGRVRIKAVQRLASVASNRFTWAIRAIVSRAGLILDGVARPDRRRVLEVLRTVGMEGYGRRLQLIRDLDLDDAISSIRRPTLFIAATRDLVVPSVSEARFMTSR
ncbi:MAG TPA: alpha/beta hydrolase, partial [Blastocatellia bacterium]|nr:alpha/beta hydrolase [Blastocatellia bacterium]